MLKSRLLAISAALAVLQVPAYALCSVPVEQIEAYDGAPPFNSSNDPYAPLNFSGSPSVTIVNNGDGGFYNNITFHADPASGDATTYSGHAMAVGNLIYGQGTSPAYGYVSDVYNIYAGQFLGPAGSGGDTSVLQPQGHTSATGPLPGVFAGGAKIINNSYVAAEANTSGGQINTSYYLDDNRRIDYMVNQADAVWVAAAVTGGQGFTQAQYLSWSNFDGLAVSGVQNSQQSFNPAGSPGKLHADLSLPQGIDASFATGTVSGYAAALWGNAQSASQDDAQHGVVVRSLLMAGADKFYYTRPSNSSSGALDPINGAGQPDYDNSLAILQSGEKSVLSLGTGSSVATTSTSVGTTQDGWAIANVSGGTQSVVLFSSANPLQGLTASLNWNVTSPTAGSALNTTAVIFPNLTLQVRPVAFNASNSTYSLGASQTDATLRSAVTGDNVQYLYSTSTIPAGSYAFVIGGDPSLTAKVGFSYTLDGVFNSQWKSSTGGTWQTAANWTNGIPNGEGAVANLLSSPGITSPATITLAGDVTLGQLIINNTNTYTIAGSSLLAIGDNGDFNYNPGIFVLGGNHVISAPLKFYYTLNASISAGASLNISSGIAGYAGLFKNGAGALILGGAGDYGTTNISAGTLTLGAGGSVTGLITVLSGGTLNFAANPGAGFLTRSEQITIAAGGVTTLSTSTASASRQLLIASGINIAGTTGQWTAKLDLSNNDLDVPGGSLSAITSQLQQGFNAAGGGNWNGSAGITSSAAGNASHLTALGVIQNNQSGAALFTSSNPFDGTTPGAADILVKYTYFGDANLDGKVDGSDYSLIDAGLLLNMSNPTAATGWYHGDFNYDGVINGADYTLIDNTFNMQDGSLAAAVSTAQIASASSVPEPASVAYISGSAIWLLRRRRWR